MHTCSNVEPVPGVATPELRMVVAAALRLQALLAKPHVARGSRYVLSFFVRKLTDWLTRISAGLVQMRPGAPQICVLTMFWPLFMTLCPVMLRPLTTNNNNHTSCLPRSSPQVDGDTTDAATPPHGLGGAVRLMELLLEARHMIRPAILVREGQLLVP